MAEVTKAQLEEQLAQEKQARATAEQAQRDAVAEVVEVRNQLTEAHNHIRTLETEKASLATVADENLRRAVDAEQLTEELNEELSQKGTVGGPATVTNGEHHYEVTAGKFKFEGKVYGREDVKSNSDLLAKLVAAGAGVISKVE